MKDPKPLPVKGIVPTVAHVSGDLYLCGHTKVTALPDGLHVAGNLDLIGFPALRALPRGLRVEGDFHLYSCPLLTETPEGMHIDGDVWLVDCPRLTRWGDGARVGEHIYLGMFDENLLSDHYVGSNSEGGKFYALPMADGMHVLNRHIGFPGFRNLTIPQALEYYGRSSGSAERAESLALVRKIAEMAA